MVKRDVVFYSIRIKCCSFSLSHKIRCSKYSPPPSLLSATFVLKTNQSGIGKILFALPLQINSFIIITLIIIIIIIVINYHCPWMFDSFPAFWDEHLCPSNKSGGGNWTQNTSNGMCDIIFGSCKVWYNPQTVLKFDFFLW